MTRKITAEIFAYRGHLGVDIDMTADFINDPQSKSQMGCVIDSKNILMTSEAKELIRTAQREPGSFAPIMLTRHSDGARSSMGFLGFGKILYKPEDILIGRDCDMSVLDDIKEHDIPIPAEFSGAIDEHLG